MENYDESNAADLIKYTSTLAKLADLEEKAEAWNDNDLTEEESLYYLQVMNRTNEKLAAVSLSLN